MCLKLDSNWDLRKVIVITLISLTDSFWDCDVLKSFVLASKRNKILKESYCNIFEFPRHTESKRQIKGKMAQKETNFN